jgi:hypothetical protein
MKHSRIQGASLLIFLASALLEISMRRGSTPFDNEPLMLGISLGLTLVAIAMNVSIIRKFGIPQKTKKVSQWLSIIITFYAFVLYIISP